MRSGEIVADEPEVISAAPEAEEVDDEPRSFSEEDIRGMSLDEFKRLRPDLDDHIDSRAGELSQKELERLLPGKIAEVREMVTQENEQRWLDYLKDNIRTADDRLKFYEEREKVEDARRERGQKVLEQSEVERAYLGKLRDNAQSWANKLLAVAPSEVDELAKRRWPAGGEGVLAYIEEVQQHLVEHGVKSGIRGQENVIASTARKDALAEVEHESPDVESGRAPTRRKETWEWFQTLPLDQRSEIRKDRARYDRIAASA